MSQSNPGWIDALWAIYILKYICRETVSKRGVTDGCYRQRNFFPGSRRDVCAARCRRESRLPATLLEEGCMCSPSQVESWLLSHSLCLSASSKVVAEFVTQESDRNIHSAEVSFPPTAQRVLFIT